MNHNGMLIGKRTLGVLLGLCWLLLAGPAAAIQENPREVVIDTSERMLKALSAERDHLKEQPGRIFVLVDEIVLPRFDFQRMSEQVLGNFWKKADAGQREAFVAQFRDLLVRTYTTALLNFSGQTIDYLPLQAAAGVTDVVVRTEVRQAGAPSIPIDYSLYANSDTWKVYDVVVDGISLVTNYRRNFANRIRRGGMDSLIADLAARNRRFSE